MSKSTPVDLGLGILDHQLVDADGQNCGKVDELELGGFGRGTPQVAEILVGGNAWRTLTSRVRPCTCRGRRSSPSPPS